MLSINSNINIVDNVKVLKSFQDGSKTEVDDFSGLLDSLKSFPPQLCKLELGSLLRSLTLKIESASFAGRASSVDGKSSRQSVVDPVRESLNFRQLSRESLIGLWRRHLESNSASKKTEAEIEKWSLRSDKSIEILSTILSDIDPLKELLVHHFKLIRQVSCAEALLLKLRSQVANLHSDSESQVQTLDLIEQDLLAVQNRSKVLERKRILVETMLVQVRFGTFRYLVFVISD